MKKIVAVTAAAALGSSAPSSALGAQGQTLSPSVNWVCTTESSPFVKMGSLTPTVWNNDDYNSLYIEVDQSVRYQTLSQTPWGGCFNDRGWAAMSKLSSQDRSNIVKDLFASQGLNLTKGRMPLGCSDYSMNRTQSYNELPPGVKTDYNLDYFTINSDRDYLIPYIKEAIKYCPDLQLWASPWSPPGWMKQNGTTYNAVTPEDKAAANGLPNAIIQTPEVLTAYAEYFVKFIQAYKNEEGLDISMVMPQNEPTINVGYSSCVWTGEQLNEFIRDYLYPAFQKANLNTEIYLGTFTDSDASRSDPTLNDPVTKSIIKGIGVQWWSAPLTKRIYRNNRDNNYVIMQSETKCGNGGNTWSYAEEHFDCMKEFLDAGVNEYMLWNMVLDEKGINTNPYSWSQNAPVIVDSKTNKVTYTPMYYVTKHFTYYIKPGARRIKTDSSHGGNEYHDKIAFQNPDGENVLVVKNRSNTDYRVSINFNGRKISPVIPAHSVNTFTVQGDNTDFCSIDSTYAEPENSDEILTMVKLFNYNTPDKSLTVSGASFKNGADIIAWSDKGAVEQQWLLYPTEDDWFRLVSFNSEKSVGVYGGEKKSGSKCVQWEWNGSYDQQWRFIPTCHNGKIYYKIQNRNSSLFLSYNNTENGTVAVISSGNGSNILWDVSISQGGYNFVSYPYTVNSINATPSDSQNLYVTINVTKNKERSAGDCLLIASYSADNELLDIISMNSDFAKGQSVNCGGSVKSSCTKIKAFVVDSPSRLEALSNVAEYNN